VVSTPIQRIDHTPPRLLTSPQHVVVGEKACEYYYWFCFSFSRDCWLSRTPAHGPFFRPSCVRSFFPPLTDSITLGLTYGECPTSDFHWPRPHVCCLFFFRGAGNRLTPSRLLWLLAVLTTPGPACPPFGKFLGFPNRNLGICPFNPCAPLQPLCSSFPLFNLFPLVFFALAFLEVQGITIAVSIPIWFTIL